MCICEMGFIKKNGNILKKTKKKQKKGSNNSSLRRVCTDNTNSCWQCLQNKTEEKQQRVYTNRKNVDGQQPFVEVVFGGRKGQNTKRNKHFSIYPPPFTLPTRKQPSIVVNVVFVIALFFPPIFSSDHYLKSHFFCLLLCVLLWAYFPFRSVSFYFFFVQQFLRFLFIFTFVNVGYLLCVWRCKFRLVMHNIGSVCQTGWVSLHNCTYVDAEKGHELSSSLCWC